MVRVAYLPPQKVAGGGCLVGGGAGRSRLGQSCWKAWLQEWLSCVEVCTCSLGCSILCCLIMTHVLAWAFVSSLGFTHEVAHPMMWT